MATIQTQISDLVPNPGVLAPLVANKFRTNNSLITSGVAVTGPEVDMLMQGGSYIQALNYVNKVDTSTFNYSSDDFDEKGATGKVTASPYMALRHDLNWGWAYTDLVRIVTKYDVKGGVVNAIPMYWSEVSENLTVAALKGCIAKVAGLTTGSVETEFDVDALIEAGATMDDPRSRKTIFASRRTIAKMQKANKNAYGLAAETGLAFDTFANHFIIQTETYGDDTAVIAQEGAVVFGAGVLPGQLGMEISRDANAGNGGGGEILRTRLSIVAAPQGFDYKGAPKPGLAGLANPDNWALAESDLSMIGFRAIKFKA